MRCAHCKKRDVDISHVKGCSGAFPEVKADNAPVGPQWPASDAAIGYALGLQGERMLPEDYRVKDEADFRAMERDEVSGAINLLKTFTRKDKEVPNPGVQVPEGRYALKDDHWTFWEVSVGKGRWKGYTFIVLLVGAPGSYRKIKVDPAKRNSILKRIAADPKQAMVDYGLESEHCGRCHSPLTNPISIARGMGDKCAAKSGWF